MKQRLQTLIQQLSAGLIERDEAVRLALLSALAGEHLLLVGRPGTAKSVLARRLHRAFHDGAYFERLLTKFSVPEELFGPLSIKALENDCYLRLTDRYLPGASIAFIDEIFKANSAILNTLLTLLNEREFDNGDARVKVPLIAVIAASNELPEDDSLQALYDRFLCRYQVQSVGDGQFAALLQLSDTLPTIDQTLPLSRDEVAAIQREAVLVRLPDEVLTLLAALRDFLRSESIPVSDRRWRKAAKWLKVAAWTDGRAAVSSWDCAMLQHCLWETPDQRQTIADWLLRYVGGGGQLGLPRLDKLVATWEQALQRDSVGEIQRIDHKGRPIFITADGRTTIDPANYATILRDGEPTYLAPADQEDRGNNGQGYTKTELQQRFFDGLYQQTHLDGQWVHIEQYVADPTNRCVTRIENAPYLEAQRHPPALIEARLAEITYLATELAELQGVVQQQLDSLEAVCSAPLWLSAEFADAARNGLRQALVLLHGLLMRLQAVADGYRRLPQHA